MEEGQILKSHRRHCRESRWTTTKTSIPSTWHQCTSGLASSSWGWQHICSGTSEFSTANGRARHCSVCLPKIHYALSAERGYHESSLGAREGANHDWSCNRSPMPRERHLLYPSPHRSPTMLCNCSCPWRRDSHWWASTLGSRRWAERTQLVCTLIGGPNGFGWRVLCNQEGSNEFSARTWEKAKTEDRAIDFT